MLALDTVEFFAQALYLVVFAFALRTALRHPRPITIETALLFGVAGCSVALGWVVGIVYPTPPRLVTDVSTALALALPYLLLRLVNEFAGTPRIVRRLAEVGLVIAAGFRIASPNPLSLPATLVLVTYFALVTLYVTWAFAREARLSVGSTARRLGAVAIGCGILCVAVLIAGVDAMVPSLVMPLGIVSGPFGLASGLAFCLGFTPPTWVLRFWREPELRDFIDRLDELSEQPDLAELLRGLQTTVSRALGLRGAFVGACDEETGELIYSAIHPASVTANLPTAARVEGGLLRTPDDVLIAGMAFTRQRSIYTDDVDEVDPANRAVYHALGVKAAIVAPMIIGAERYGVVGVYAPRPRMFGEEALAHLEALARHAAHMLRSRQLLERAAAMRAEEQVTRLKENFLSSATHDLKTPLTAIRGSAQLALRRARRSSGPEGSETVEDLTRIVESVDRMAGLIDEVLDISRLQLARPLELDCANVNLAALLRLVAARHQQLGSQHHISVDGPELVDGQWDSRRLERALDNLIGNAIKFSPAGGEIAISVAANNGSATVSIRDQGIGMPLNEIDRLFDRFERGSNAVAQGIGGTGIGLAYVREVVTAHGGEVCVESKVGTGSVFTVDLPRAKASSAPSVE